MPPKVERHDDPNRNKTTDATPASGINAEAQTLLKLKNPQTDKQTQADEKLGLHPMQFFDSSKPAPEAKQADEFSKLSKTYADGHNPPGTTTPLEGGGQMVVSKDSNGNLLKAEISTGSTHILAIQSADGSYDLLVRKAGELGTTAMSGPDGKISINVGDATHPPSISFDNGLNLLTFSADGKDITDFKNGQTTTDNNDGTHTDHYSLPDSGTVSAEYKGRNESPTKVVVTTKDGDHIVYSASGVRAVIHKDGSSSGPKPCDPNEMKMAIKTAQDALGIRSDQ